MDGTTPRHSVAAREVQENAAMSSWANSLSILLTGSVCVCSGCGATRGFHWRISHRQPCVQETYNPVVIPTPSSDVVQPPVQEAQPQETAPPVMEDNFYPQPPQPQSRPRIKGEPTPAEDDMPPMPPSEDEDRSSANFEPEYEPAPEPKPTRMRNVLRPTSSESEEDSAVENLGEGPIAMQIRPRATGHTVAPAPLSSDVVQPVSGVAEWPPFTTIRPRTTPRPYAGHTSRPRSN
jgi:hypothetical protein